MGGRRGDPCNGTCVAVIRAGVFSVKLRGVKGNGRVFATKLARDGARCRATRSDGRHITLGTSSRHAFARTHARTFTPHRPAIIQTRHLERRPLSHSAHWHAATHAGVPLPPTHRHRHPQTMPAPDPLDDVDMTVPMLMMLSCAPALNHAPHPARPTERPTPCPFQSRRVRLLHVLQQGLEARQERKQGQATRS